MATNVDKTLYPATQGLGAINTEEPALEIEIADDDATPGMQDDGSMIIDMSGAKGDAKPEDTTFGANLAESMEDATLSTLAGELEFEIDNDRRGRTDWERTYKEGLGLLGLKIEERSEPWDGACGIVHPMITEAVVRFQAETTTETFPASGPVRSKIVGLETPDKKASAQRVEDDMNFMLTESMPEFRPEHERLLWELPAVGCAFKKVYYDESLGRPVSMFVSAEDVILPYGVTSIVTTPRITHVMRKTKDEVQRLIEAGMYRDVDLTEAPLQTDDIKDAKDKEIGASAINDDRFVIYESHANLYIDSDSKRKKNSKVAMPYVVTWIRQEHDKVLAIRRNWAEDDKKYTKRQHFVQYDYVPGFGAYGYGLFHLIGGYAKGATSILRQLVDAGTLSNLPGGLKTRGLRIKGDDTPIAPGEFRDVDIGSGTIKDNILPLPYKEPSLVLAGTLDKIVEDARRFAATADMQISDMSAQAPVGTTLAILERQLKVLTAVQARVHYALKNELKLLKEIVRDYMGGRYEYAPATGKKTDKRADYEVVDVIPVSDPNAATLSQRVVQYQAAIQMAQMAPEIYDLPQLHRDMLETLGFKNAQKIIPLTEDMKPMDPVTENMALLQSKPVKAFIYQDHMAHIRVHQSAMQDPQIMQFIGQNPKMPMMMGAAMAHIAEHTAYLYRQQIEGQLGMTLPPMEQTLPPQIEATLSGMMAQAAQQLLQQNQALGAQQAQQAAAQDPMLALQQQELQVKQEQTAIQKMKVVGELAAKADAQALKEQEVQAKYQLEGTRVGAQIQDQKAKVVGQNMQAGMKMGLEQRAQQHDHSMAQGEQAHQQQLELAGHSLDAQQQAHQQGLEREQFAADTAHKAHQVVSQNTQHGEKLAHTSQMQRESQAHAAELQDQKVKSEEKKAALQAKAAEKAAAKQAKSPAAKKPAAKKAAPKK